MQTSSSSVAPRGGIAARSAGTQCSGSVLRSPPRRQSRRDVSGTWIRPRLGACPETAVHGSGGTVSASIRRRWARVRERPTRAAPHRRSDGAPAPVLRRHGPRVGPRATRPPLRPAPAAGAGSGGAGEVPFVAHVRHAAEHEATKAHHLLALGVPAKDVRHARGAEERSGEAGAPSERL